jgi:outer membrane protein TolC
MEFVAHRALSVVILLVAAGAPGPDVWADEPKPLTIQGLVQSVYNQYPPYLAALIERDVAQGRLQSASGAFDFRTFVNIFNTSGYYDATTLDAGFEQFTGVWGSTLYGGYRITDGSLPDYYYERRTNEGGAPQVGIKLPLLQNREIDERRAAVYKAKLETEQADPKIRKQQLDFTKAAMFAYYNWFAEAKKLRAAEELLRIAQDRAQAVSTQIEKGLVAPIIKVENDQMVISRELSMLKAQRSFEAGAIALSLFHRNASGVPVIPEIERVPRQLVEPFGVSAGAMASAIDYANRNRPELVYLRLELEKLGIDTRLYQNKTLPKLDTFVSASKGLGEKLYKDTDDVEVKSGIQFSVPLQRNEAKGKLAENAAKTEQTEQEYRFAMERTAAEIQNAYSAVRLALDQLNRAKRNSELALQLQKVEQDRFNLGAADLLNLMIREQAAFQARLDEIDSANQYFKAISDFVMAAGINLRDGNSMTVELRKVVDALGLDATK